MASDTALAIFFQPPRPRGVRQRRRDNIFRHPVLSTPAPAGSETQHLPTVLDGVVLSTPAPAGSETGDDIRPPV